MSSIEPFIFNPVIRRKRTFEETFEFTDLNDVPLDLTGYVFCAQARKEQRVGSDLVFEFNLDLTNAATGLVRIYLDEVETDDIEESTCYWDLLAEIGSTRENWVEGKVEVRGSVSDVS
jgi:hypothetical protein